MLAPATAAAAACAASAGGVASLEPSSQAPKQPAVLPRRHNDDSDDEVFDFVASEAVASSRASPSYTDRGPLMICSGDSSPSLAAQIGEQGAWCLACAPGLRPGWSLAFHEPVAACLRAGLAASNLGVDVADVQSGKFADGETSVRAYQGVRGRDVFIVQSTSRPVNESIITLVLLITAIRRAEANKITAVIPYYGYSRAVGAPPVSLDSQTAQLMAASRLATMAPGALIDAGDSALLEADLSVYGSGGSTEARPISAADTARILEEAGVDGVIAVDLQAPGRGQIEVS